MNTYIVTFELINRDKRTEKINAKSVKDAKIKIANANGYVTYFESICVNDEKE